MDPSRAELWQQHRDQITARRLILDAQAAHAEGDHQRAQELLTDARQIDPRMPAIWDGDLPAVPLAQPARHEPDATTHGPDDAVDTGHAAQAHAQHRVPAAPAAPGRMTRRPSWPSAPARRDPAHSVPGSPEAEEREPSAQPPAGAAPHPETSGDATADNPDADAGPPGTARARWPAPNPRAGQAEVPGQQRRHEATARQESVIRQSPDAAPESVLSRKTASRRPAAPSADWRDQVLRDARQPWQPAPSWPHNPALYRPPDASASDAGIELEGPDT